MKKISIILLILCYLFLQIPPYTFAQETDATVKATTDEETVPQMNSAVASGSYSLDAVNAMLGTEKIVDNARAAIVYEVNSQTLMYAWNPDAQMYPASLVKLLTALLAIEEGDLSDVVTVSQNAIDSVPRDAVSANLVAGERLNLEELLYCLLLGSANDAAAVIAEHISGTQDAFVAQMNQYAQELGCTSSSFTNVHGLHDDNQHTTARDTAKILDAALKNETFKTIFTADEYTVGATNLSLDRKLTNSNSMKDTASKLYYDERVIGGRTGVTKDGRRCLATVAESNGMLVISVVMGAESVYQEDGYSAISIGGYRETTELFDACLSGYKTAQILYSGQVLRQIPMESADCDLMIGPKVSVSTVLPQDIVLANLSFSYADKPFVLPISEGQHVSDVQIWHGGMCVAQAELYAMNDVGSADSVRSEEQSGKDDRNYTAVWVILGTIAGAVVMVVGVRFYGRIHFKIVGLRKRRYRRSRKRVR